jgi:hypothetical protein
MTAGELLTLRGLNVIIREYQNRIKNVPGNQYIFCPVRSWQGFRILILLILILLIAPGLSAESIQDTNEPGMSPGVWGPWITSTTSSSSTIHWKTAELQPGTIEYIARDDLLRGKGEFLPVSDMMPAELHTVFLCGLCPGTDYLYRIEGQPGNYSFSTYPESGTIRFVVYGDTRNQEGWKNQDALQTSVARGIAAEKNILFVLHTGDIVYDPKNLSEWGGFFEKSGVYLPNVTFCPVPGNHEVSSAEYTDLFGLPDDYTFQCGNITVICIDSNPMNKTRENAQYSWLAGTLRESINPVFVAMHHPLYSSDEKHPGGNTNLRLRYEPFFIHSGTDAVFSAHVHAYEHYESAGIHYFTVATGGAPFYPLLAEKPAGHIFSLENTAGYAVVTVNETATLFEFIRVAEERDGLVRLFPPGDVAERVVIHKKPDRWPGIFQGLPDFSNGPDQVLNMDIKGMSDLFVASDLKYGF